MAQCILVVDDSPILLEQMVGILDDNGFNVHGVPDGERALSLLRTDPRHFDMVISDMRMPNVGDGLKLLAAIKADEALKHLPVMMTSATFTPDEIGEVGRLGAFAWSNKPFDALALISVINAEFARLRLSNTRFLVVDNFSTMRRIVRGLLKEMGCNNADEAEDGAVALGMLKASKYDFVISDINMPKMNGFELLRAIKADESLKHLPVLMVTAEMRKEDIMFAAQNGAAGYLIKPFTKATLEEKVQRILQKLAAAK